MCECGAIRLLRDDGARSPTGTVEQSSHKPTPGPTNSAEGRLAQTGALLPLLLYGERVGFTHGRHENEAASSRARAPGPEAVAGHSHERHRQKRGFQGAVRGVRCDLAALLA